MIEHLRSVTTTRPRTTAPATTAGPFATTAATTRAVPATTATTTADPRPVRRAAVPSSAAGTRPLGYFASARRR